MSQPCGTSAAYQRHKRNREEACEPCKQAQREAMAAYRASHPDSRIKEARKNNARQRALWRLAQERPARFQKLYEQELSKMEY